MWESEFVCSYVFAYVCMLCVCVRRSHGLGQGQGHGESEGERETGITVGEIDGIDHIGAERD